MERIVKILWSRIDPDSVENLREKYYCHLDLKRQKRIDSCRSDSKRAELITGGALLIKALEDAGLTKAKISYAKNGKPYVEAEGFYFNLSHSGDIAAVAVSDEDLGFDIQKPVKAKESLLKRVLSPGERKSFDPKDTGFNRIWSLKESYSKLTGEGIGTDFSDTGFEKDPKTGLYNVTYSGRACGFAREFSLFEGYSAAVCMAEPFVISDLCEIRLL